MQGLVGRRALVTGATGGIGRAIAIKLAECGALVVVTGRDIVRAQEVADRITGNGGLARAVVANLDDVASVDALVREATEAAGGAIDILVNNAARLVPGQSMFDATEELIDEVLAMNIKVPFLLTARLARPMVDAGCGAIINVGSINGEVGMAVAALYGASKAGLHSLTKSFAAELASHGVRVNTVVPGPTLTETNINNHARIEQMALSLPDRRPGSAEEVAALVAFLASDDCRHITGASIPVDGGALNVLTFSGR